ncbi:hypothetical protein DPMN_023142 [Dreissena polymorpha]|uniref:Uncharacterized protein n=1 Tax=Dreissena polymorpha TaxID=45954 RepID=A0A9D4R9M4_DREPO|nr:hypothetical protein DPMN_023142 [Dreissena polymorpha]
MIEPTEYDDAVLKHKSRISSWVQCRASSDIDIRHKSRISTWVDCRASSDSNIRN